MSIQIFKCTKSSFELVKTTEQSTIAEIWDESYGKYAYKFKRGTIGKPINRKSFVCKHDVLFSDTPGLCEDHKSKSLHLVGEDYFDLASRQDPRRTVPLVRCVAPKIDKI